MSLELIENKSSIGSGALKDPVFILHYRVIRQWLLTHRRSVGNHSAISWGAIGNRLATGRRLVGDCILSVCFWLQKVCNFLEIDRQLIGDWSTISRRLKTLSGLSATAATGRRSVGNQSATCRRPPKTVLRSIWLHRRFTCSNQNLLASESSLQLSATGWRPVADLLATAVQPPCDHNFKWSQGGCTAVARRSATGRQPVASYVWLGFSWQSNNNQPEEFTVRWIYKRINHFL